MQWPRGKSSPSQQRQVVIAAFDSSTRRPLLRVHRRRALAGSCRMFSTFLQVSRRFVPSGSGCRSCVPALGPPPQGKFLCALPLFLFCRAPPRRAAPHCCAHVQLVVRDAWHAHPSESGCYRSVVPSVQFVCSSSTRLCVWRSVHCTGSLSWACMLSPSSVSVSVAESAHCALRPVVCLLTFLSLLHRTPAVILRKCRRQRGTGSTSVRSP